jgi:hypothetical protein
MSKLTKLLGLGAIAAVAGTIGFHALAQTPPAGGPIGAGGMGPAAMMGHGPRGFADPASRLALLKTELGVTAAQSPAWDSYVKTVEDTSAAMRAKLQATGRPALRDMSPEDRARFRTEMQAEREQAASTVNAAATKLAAALDDGQKAKAVTILLALEGHGPGMGRFVVPGPAGAR